VSADIKIRRENNTAHTVKRGEPFLLLLFISIVFLTFFETNTTLVEADAASGGAMFNAALYPEILGFLLLGLIMREAVHLFKSRSQIREMDFQKNLIHMRPVRLVASFAILLSYVLLMKPVGFYISTIFFMFSFFYLLGTRKIKIALALSVISTFSVAFVFEYILKVILPVGMFEIGF